MTYFVVLQDTTILEMSGLDLHLLKEPAYAISESRRSAVYNALLCLGGKFKELERKDHPGVGLWWLEDYKSLLARKEELLELSRAE